MTFPAVSNSVWTGKNRAKSRPPAANSTRYSPGASPPTVARDQPSSPGSSATSMVAPFGRLGSRHEARRALRQDRPCGPPVSPARRVRKGRRLRRSRSFGIESDSSPRSLSRFSAWSCFGQSTQIAEHEFLIREATHAARPRSSRGSHSAWIGTVGSPRCGRRAQPRRRLPSPGRASPAPSARPSARVHPRPSIGASVAASPRPGSSRSHSTDIGRRPGAAPRRRRAPRASRPVHGPAPESSPSSAGQLQDPPRADSVATIEVSRQELVHRGERPQRPGRVHPQRFEPIRHKVDRLDRASVGRAEGNQGHGSRAWPSRVSRLY